MLANVVSNVLVVSHGAGKGQGFHAIFFSCFLFCGCHRWGCPNLISCLIRILFGAFVGGVGRMGGNTSGPKEIMHASAPGRSGPRRCMNECFIQLLAGPALGDS